MATRTTPGNETDVSIPGGRFQRADGSRRPERLATETKASFKTSEFISYVVVLAGILIAGMAIEDKGGNDFFAADKVWLYATILTVGYMVSRGLAKAGTRDPYWAGGTNQNRDDDIR